MAVAKGLPYIGLAPSLLKNPLRTMIEAAREGDVVQMKMPGVKLFLVHNPEYVKYVLAHDEIYIKGGQVKPYKKLFGTSVLTTEGAEWKRHRLIVQPAFHRQSIQSFAAIFRDETLRMTERWAALPGDPATVNCLQEMKAVTQSIIVKTLFGTNLQDIKEEDVDQALDDVFGSVKRMVWSSGLPDFMQRLTGGKKQADSFKRGMQVLHGVINRLIAQRSGREPERQDLLDMLLHARHEDGTPISHEQIRDELITFFVAGHETTAVALSWAWIALSRNPAVREKLHAELDQIDHPPSFEDLPNLPYTRSVFNEALRTGPPAWFIPRSVKTTDTIDGTVIPAGAIVVVSPYLAHRHPRFWDEPDAFRPERFLDNLRNPANFYPFGFGARQCIAKEFALMEGPLILANAAKRYQLQLKYDDPIEPSPGSTLNPRQQNRQGIAMTLRRR